MTDEAQRRSGDQQMLSGRVKRGGGLSQFIGDKHQDRSSVVAGLQPEHVTAIEKAFPGGVFHPALEEPVTLHRAAVVEAAVEELSILPLHYDPADQARIDRPGRGAPPSLATRRANAEGVVDPEAGPSEPHAQVRDEALSPTSPANSEAGRQAGAEGEERSTDVHPLRYLEVALASKDDREKYRRMLRRTVEILRVTPPAPLNVGQAYGIDPEGGVVPLALVHSNRLRREVAAILGTFFRYPAEPLTGTNQPCPPGPGLREPWSDFPYPWVFVDIPASYYGFWQADAYQRARNAGGPTPPNLPAQRLMFELQLAFERAFRGRVTEEDGMAAGPMRVLFSYRSDADDYASFMARKVTDGARGGVFRGSGPAYRVRDERDDRVGRESHVAVCTQVTTITAATGDTKNIVFAALENNTSFVRDDAQFLVAASRARQLTIFLGDERDLRTNASDRVRGCVQTLAQLGAVCRPVHQSPNRSFSSVAAEVVRFVAGPRLPRGTDEEAADRATQAAANAAKQIGAKVGGEVVSEPVREMRMGRTQRSGRAATVGRLRGTASAVAFHAAGDHPAGAHGEVPAPDESVDHKALAAQAFARLRASGLTEEGVGLAIRHAPTEHLWATVMVSNLSPASKLAAYADCIPAVEDILAHILAHACRTEATLKECGEAWFVKVHRGKAPGPAEAYWDCWRSESHIRHYLQASGAVNGYLQPVRYEVRASKAVSNAAGGSGPRARHSPKDQCPRKAWITLPLPVAVALARALHEDDRAEETVSGDTQQDAAPEPWDLFLLGERQGRRLKRCATLSKYVTFRGHVRPHHGVSAALAALKLADAELPSDDEVRQLWIDSPPDRRGANGRWQFPNNPTEYTAMRQANTKFYFTFAAAHFVAPRLEKWYAGEVRAEGMAKDRKSLLRQMAATGPEACGVPVAQAIGAMTWGPYLLAYGEGVPPVDADTIRDLTWDHLVDRQDARGWPKERGGDLLPGPPWGAQEGGRSRRRAWKAKQQGQEPPSPCTPPAAPSGKRRKLGAHDSPVTADVSSHSDDDEDWPRPAEDSDHEHRVVLTAREDAPVQPEYPESIDGEPLTSDAVVSEDEPDSGWWDTSARGRWGQDPGWWTGHAWSSWGGWESTGRWHERPYGGSAGTARAPVWSGHGNRQRWQGWQDQSSWRSSARRPWRDQLHW